MKRNESPLGSALLAIGKCDSWMCFITVNPEFQQVEPVFLFSEQAYLEDGWWRGRQNLSRFPLSVVIIAAHSNRMRDLKPFVPKFSRLLRQSSEVKFYGWLLNSHHLNYPAFSEMKPQADLLEGLHRRRKRT